MWLIRSWGSRHMQKRFFLRLAVLILGGIACYLFVEKPSVKTAEINAIFGGVGYEFDAAKHQVSRWSQSSGHVVKVTPAVRGTDNRLQQYLPHFNTPAIDVYQVDVSWAPMLADVMEDLSQHFSQEELQVFQKDILNAGTFKGKLVFIPLYVQWLRLYVRKDLLDKYNKPIPKTWEELVDTARFVMDQEEANRCKKNPLWGLVFMGQPYEGMTCVALSVMASMPGGCNVFNDKAELDISCAGNMRAWKVLHSWIYGEKGKKPITPKSVLAYAQETARQMFQRGDALFMINWPYAEALLQSNGSPVQGKFVVVDLPYGVGGKPSPMLGGGALSVSVYSKNKEAAISLVRSMVSASDQKWRATEYGYVSARSDVVEDAEVQASRMSLRGVSNVWSMAIARPASRFKRWSAAGFVFGDSLHRYLQTPGNNPQETLENLQQVFRGMLVEQKGRC